MDALAVECRTREQLTEAKNKEIHITDSRLQLALEVELQVGAASLCF